MFQKAMNRIKVSGSRIIIQKVSGQLLAGSWRVTEDPQPSWNTVATISSRVAQAQDKEGSAPQAHKGRQRIVRVPKVQHKDTGERSPERGPQLPQPSFFSHSRASFRPQASSSPNRHIWPLALPFNHLSAVLLNQGGPS